MPDRFHRRSVRLQGYDYTRAGAYFLTICTYQRELLFQETAASKIVEEQWELSAAIREEISLDAFVVMPNHIHGVVWILEDSRGVGAQGLAPLQMQANSVMPRIVPRSLGSFVRGFKSSVTRAVHALHNTRGVPIWQRNYYEHVVRNEEELNRIRQYIADNLAKWDEDENNPANIFLARRR